MRLGWVLLYLLLASPDTAEQRLRRMLASPSGIVHLPSGPIELTSGIQLPAGLHDVTITGDHTVLRAARTFHGRAMIGCSGCRHVSLRNFSMDGNREALEIRQPVPPSGSSFASFFASNAMLFEGADEVAIENVQFSNVPGFAILVSKSANIAIDHVSVSDSGSRNQRGRNNTSGGILLEEGSGPFSVLNSTFRNIRGNGVWTHSRGSPRSHDGTIAGNTFAGLGRDAIQAGHATRIRVLDNKASRIGMNLEEVDVEGGGTPVGIDTAGNVDASVYEKNRFEEVNGKCIDLDGFHDGAVRDNTCINQGKAEDYAYGNIGIVFNDASIEMRSENIVVENNDLSGMKYGGIFVLGEGHTIRNNRMTRLNLAHCNESHPRFNCFVIPGEPGVLESGIYLAKGVSRVSVSRRILIEGNVISGYKIAAHCIEAAPTVKLSENTIRNNKCRDE